MRTTIPVARRVFGEGDECTLSMRTNYAMALMNTGATLDDLREAVAMSEESGRTARRIFGGAHPLVGWIEKDLSNARAVLRARETPQEGG